MDEYIEQIKKLAEEKAKIAEKYFYAKSALIFIVTVVIVDLIVHDWWEGFVIGFFAWIGYFSIHDR